MTNIELIEFRASLGISRNKFAKMLGMSPSRIKDYEIGSTRGRGSPAPIPRVVELAIETLKKVATAP